MEGDYFSTDDYCERLSHDTASEALTYWLENFDTREEAEKALPVKLYAWSQREHCKNAADDFADYLFENLENSWTEEYGDTDGGDDLSASKEACMPLLKQAAQAFLDKAVVWQHDITDTQELKTLEEVGAIADIDAFFPVKP